MKIDIFDKAEKVKDGAGAMRAYQDMLYGKHKGNSKIKEEYKMPYSAIANWIHLPWLLSGSIGWICLRRDSLGNFRKRNYGLFSNHPKNATPIVFSFCFLLFT